MFMQGRGMALAAHGKEKKLKKEKEKRKKRRKTKEIQRSFNFFQSSHLAWLVGWLVCVV